ncbi:IgGFc-binding protein [Vibrio harveyi]|nr:IgGFc-binding protein [Vibrio harveyi]
MLYYIKTFTSLLVLILLFPLTGYAQVDSRGKEFVLAFPKNHEARGTRSLFISSEHDAEGTVTVSGLATVEPFSLKANEVKRIDLPIQVESMSSDAVSQRGVRVVANQEVSVYGLNQYQHTTDAYLGLPIDSLGVNYIVASYQPTWSSMPSQLTVVAAYDGTNVTITPSKNAGSRAAGQPYTITLDRDETYYLEATQDLTGSSISSDLPVAVFGGVRCVNIPSNVSACDHVVEMIPPVSTWGKSFHTFPLATRRNGEVFRVIASEDNTAVTINGSVVVQLQEGEFFETVLRAASVVETNAPSLLVQYSPGSSFDGVTSDPFMMIVPPSEQFLSEYSFTSLGRDSGFTNGFVSVVIPTDGVGDLSLNGELVNAESFSPIGASGYSGAQIKLNQGSHVIAGTMPFGIYAYGFGSYDSYGYTGGMAFEFINPKGDRFAPNVALVQLGDAIQGIAGDSEDLNLNGILDEGEDLNQNQIIDRRTEDVNGNGVLDEGEDLNQDGVLDVDTGIFRVTLSDDSENLKLDTAAFVPGALEVNFQVTLLDDSAPGTGTLIVSDGAGNKVERPLVLNNAPTMSDVTVFSLLSTTDIDLDLTSFAREPDRISQLEGTTVLEWDFVNFSIAQQVDMGYELVVTNLKPNEIRIVTQDLVLEYTNVDGDRIRNELGQQVIEVANSVFDLIANIDKSIYISGENVVITGNVFNLSSFPADASLQLYIKDEQGYVVAVLKDITVAQLEQGVALQIDDAMFNTDGIILGDYQVVAVLTDQLSGVPIEVTRPFTVTAENGQFADIKASLSTDKPVYGQWDTVQIDVLVQNLADYSVVENATGYLSLTRPNQPAVVIETVTLPSLSSQLYRQYQVTLPLDRASVGDYTLLWEVRNSDHQILAATEASFAVAASISNSILGEVTLDKTKLFYADANQCHLSTTNRGTSDIVDLPVKYTVINVESEVVVHEVTKTLSLTELETHTDMLDLNTKVASGYYICAVQVQLDGQWKDVGAEKFEVIIDVSLTERFGEVLILQDPATDNLNDPHGPDGVTLPAQQTATVAALKALGWQVNYLTDEDEFVSALSTDSADLILVVPELAILTDETQRLLNYHTFLGDGAFVSQRVALRQPLLAQMLGLEVARTQPDVMGIQQSENGTVWQFVYPDSAYTFHPVGAAEVAGYQLSEDGMRWQYTDGQQCLVTQTPPALSWFEFGRGKTSYAGFDLLAQSLDKAYIPLFNQTMESLYQTEYQLWQAQPKPITFTLKSSTSPVLGKLKLSLSPGLVMVDSGQMSADGGGWTLPFDLGQQPITSTTITVVGMQPGAENIQLVVVTGEGEHLQEQESRLLAVTVNAVASLDTFVTAVKLEIEAQPRSLALKMANLALERAVNAHYKGKEPEAARLLDEVIMYLHQVELSDESILMSIIKHRLTLSPINDVDQCSDDDCDDDEEENEDE